MIDLDDAYIKRKYYEAGYEAGKEERLKTMESAREELVEKLMKELTFLETKDQEILRQTFRTAFDFGAAEAHMRAKVLLEALEDFQKSIYKVIGGER